MILNRRLLSELVVRKGSSLPPDHVFHLPEKVLQFGTGVLLRALTDHYIDSANRTGAYGGRIVVVKSTESGRTDAFEAQDGLYTTVFRGVYKGLPVDHAYVNASISRVLRAKDDWGALLRFAESPDWELIVSNTTEVGIILSDEDVCTGQAPHSFPGKLLALLHHRFLHFDGDGTKGIVVVPTELIEQNGRKLRSILLTMAESNGLSESFIAWLGESNHFCDSLVDRIVPGAMSASDHEAKERQLGYSDALMIMAEPYGLWAIESSAPDVLQRLGFRNEDAGCIVVPSIERYREYKLRLLNGTHTFSCGVALMAGCTTVRDAVTHPEVGPFMKRLLEDEILMLVRQDETDTPAVDAFAASVWDRLSNPYLDHRWSSISAQFTSKMRMRNLPLMLRVLQGNGKLPPGMLHGFCAYLACMDSNPSPHGGYIYHRTAPSFLLNDPFAENMHRYWSLRDLSETVQAILSDVNLWGEDLSRWPGLGDDVLGQLRWMTPSTRYPISPD